MGRMNVGVQPARIELFKRGMQIQDIAQRIGVPRSHLAKVLRGVQRPCPEVLDRLPNLLGMAVDELFTPEILATPYNPRKIPWADARKRAGVS